MSMLTVAMIVKNEAQLIEKVIQNVRPVADEIVVTDTGSTDGTLDIIKKFKLRLFHYNYKGDRARARNFTLSKCKTGWTLFIDADEFLDTGDYQKVRQLISGENRYIAYRILLRHYLDSRVNLKNLEQRDWTNSYILHTIVRIFKNNEGIFYSRPIYPSVDESLRGRSDKVGNSGIIFHHLDILRNKQKKIEKAKWYCYDVFENLKKYPHDPEVNYIVAHYYRLRGEFDQAIRYYKKALELKTGHIKARLSLGLSYVMLGEEAKGIQLIKGCRNNNGVYPWEIESYLNSAFKIIALRVHGKRYEKSPI